MLCIGSGELCEFRYQDNSEQNRFCENSALYAQLETQIGSSFFRGRFSRDLNHRLLGTFQLNRASLIGIKSVINPIGILNCEFNDPCYEIKLDLRVRNKKEVVSHFLPFQSFLIRNLTELRELNYVDDLNSSLQQDPLRCLVGIVPRGTYFRKITINPQTDTNDSYIRSKFRCEEVDDDRILGFSTDKRLETIINVASRNCS